jgi:hypothetical protein
VTPSRDDDDENIKPHVWPTSGVGVLSGVQEVQTDDGGRPSWRSLTGSLHSPSLISCDTKAKTVH